MPGFLRRLFTSQTATPTSWQSTSTAGDGAERKQSRLTIELDDWGFAELVHQSHLPAIEKEMRAISEIEVGTYGSTDFHFRDQIKEPLVPSVIPLKALHDLFPGRMDYVGVGYWGEDGAAEHSYAFSTRGGMALYGEHRPGSGSGQLRSIFFERCHQPDMHILSAEIEALVQFAVRQQLYLLCWNQEFCSQPDIGRYLRFFEQYT
jgi:hypothetical protein